MSQAEVTKLTQYAVIGSLADNAVVSKLTMYVVLVPGSDGGAPAAARQVHVTAQKIERS